MQVLFSTVKNEAKQQLDSESFMCYEVMKILVIHWSFINHVYLKADDQRHYQTLTFFSIYFRHKLKFVSDLSTQTILFENVSSIILKLLHLSRYISKCLIKEITHS